MLSSCGYLGTQKAAVTKNSLQQMLSCLPMPQSAREQLLSSLVEISILQALLEDRRTGIAVVGITVMIKIKAGKHPHPDFSFTIHLVFSISQRAFSQSQRV